MKEIFKQGEGLNKSGTSLVCTYLSRVDPRWHVPLCISSTGDQVTEPKGDALTVTCALQRPSSAKRLPWTSHRSVSCSWRHFSENEKPKSPS